MPTYEFECSQCKKTFTEKMSFEEHGKKKVKCPKCGSSKVTQVLSAVFVKTSKKS